MGRERHHNRQRSIYALTFSGRPRFCYIGQSVDPSARIGQHRRSGDWDNLGDVVMTHLGTYTGTRAQLEEWEMAWRISAHRAGWSVYGGSGDDGPYAINPMKRTTQERMRMSRQCRWPWARRWPWAWIVGGVLIVLAALAVLSQ